MVFFSKTTYILKYKEYIVYRERKRKREFLSLLPPKNMTHSEGGTTDYFFSFLFFWYETICNYVSSMKSNASQVTSKCILVIDT